METVIEGYQVISELQRGPLSTVYKALQIRLERTVILKVLNRHVSEDDEIRERFAREARSLARIRHNNIVTVYDYGISGDHAFIAMEYISGSTLAQYLKKNGPLDGVKTESLFDQIGSALRYIHSLGIVHRDVKPDNILIDDEGHFRLTDFGLAHLVDGNHMTQQGASLGTPAYMAPELIEGAPASAAADIFSFGVTLYEALTGVSPFKSEQIAATLQNVLGRDIDFSDPPVAETWRERLQLMLQKDVSKRAGWDDLVQKESSAALRHAEDHSKSRKRTLFWIVPLLVFAVIAVMALLHEAPEITNSAQSAGDSSAFTARADTIGRIKSNVTETGADSAKTAGTVQKTATPNEAIAQKDKVDESAIHPDSAMGRLHVRAVPWAEVYLDNGYVQTTPFTLERKAGDYTLEFRHPSRQNITRTVRLAAGNSDTLDVLLPAVNGFLSVLAVPWGNVFVNGELVGETPLQDFALPQGRHVLRIENPSYPALVDTIRIEAGKVTEKRFSFISSGI